MNIREGKEGGPRLRENEGSPISEPQMSGRGCRPWTRPKAPEYFDGVLETCRRFDHQLGFLEDATMPLQPLQTRPSRGTLGDSH
jgi:hypothetical protein